MEGYVRLNIHCETHWPKCEFPEQKHAVAVDADSV